MRLRPGLGICLVVLLALGPAGAAPAAAEGFDVSRPKVKRSTRARSGPTLPSDEEEPGEEVPAEVPADADSAWEDYYREKAEYYREKRETERARRSGGAACMYGADGSVIYAPPGRDC